MTGSWPLPSGSWERYEPYTLGQTMCNLDELQSFFEGHLISDEPLSTKEGGRLWSRWRHAFGGTPEASARPKSLGGYAWHVFSYGLAPCEEGTAALAAYQALPDRDYFVLSQDRVPPAFRCHSEELPVAGTLGIDLYVVSLEFIWTMVFTHEGPPVSSLRMGPYFSRSEWQTSSGG